MLYRAYGKTGKQVSAISCGGSNGSRPHRACGQRNKPEKFTSFHRIPFCVLQHPAAHAA